MHITDLNAADPLLFGANRTPGLVAVEWLPAAGDSPDQMRLFLRRGAETVIQDEPFTPFIVATRAAAAACTAPHRAETLSGDAPLNTTLWFTRWRACGQARQALARATARNATDADAPYLFVSDAVQQHLLVTGRTLFADMRFEDVRRLQLDIECDTTPGFEFCNAEREGDRILAIGLADQTGWTSLLVDEDERRLLERFVAVVRERDPDVIEGHNLFNFDLPYLAARAARLGVTLALGRDGSPPERRPGRFSAGGRTLTYDRFDLHGRHIVDTLFLLHDYDAGHRALDGFGLKQAAIHFGVAAADRTYLEGARIGDEFRRDPERVLRYLRDDLAETGALAGILAPSYFAQAQVLPLSYQNVCVRGSAAKIDALMLREYLRQRHALPQPDAARPFEGGYTDMFREGVIRNVHHCDVRSLYPSLMLVQRLAPARDTLGIFLRLLEQLRDFRLRAKAAQRQAATPHEQNYYGALQTSFKLLINAFYGYLGFAQARFSDFAAAEAVARGGRELLAGMIAWLKAHGAEPIELDTDGIYYVPPPGETADSQARFRAALAASLPAGIELEFDGEYVAMFSYKIKNYALLGAHGEVTIKGAALKSRGLEPFQRDFLRDVIRFKLEGRERELPALKRQAEEAIRRRQWPIARLAKTETLQDAPATYAAGKGRGDRARSAAYELALRSNREYRAGDQVSYYVTGDRKSVAVHESARLVADWDPTRRDENVAYYAAKLDELYRKFCDEAPPAQLSLL